MRLARGWRFDRKRQLWNFYREGKLVLVVTAEAAPEIAESYFIARGMPAPGLVITSEPTP